MLKSQKIKLFEKKFFSSLNDFILNINAIDHLILFSQL